MPLVSSLSTTIKAKPAINVSVLAVIVTEKPVAFSALQ